MFDKLKKTLGRRKPLEAIPLPNSIASSPTIDDDRKILKEHFNNILSDPETLESHYKEMLSSRGTSDFAHGQMTQLPDATKRELVRMWLMSASENGGPRERNSSAEAAGGVTRKRAHSDASAKKSLEDDIKRQKTENRRTFVDMIAPGKQEQAPPLQITPPLSPRSDMLPEIVAVSRRHTGSSDGEQLRPETAASSSSQDSTQSSASIPSHWVDDVKHMQYVVTHRDEYDPKVTKDMDFEKMIIRLRLFLRAESIKCLKQFIDAGGLAGLVGIVTGILDVEWREQHETRFLLGILHCIRIILKTHEGANRFYALGQHNTLFPRLVRMQFSWGEERRAFFRFDHRAVITEIFYYWIRNVDHKKSTLADRANKVLEYLQDFPDKEIQHHEFVAVMHKLRRYKNWHKEVKNTTQPWLGTPWMYYHKENVISAREKLEQEEAEAEAAAAAAAAGKMTGTATAAATAAAMMKNEKKKKDFSDEFAPTRRPELVSSTVRSHTETLVAHYVAANVDLMNMCIVAQPDAARRNALRREFADCGFEELFGSKLRLASQANFPCIDSTLRDWVTAANADGWPVAHVTAADSDKKKKKKKNGGLMGDASPSSPPPNLLKFDVLEDTPFDF